MRDYEVVFSHAALIDYTAISKYLPTVLSEHGAAKYAQAMREEILTIGIYADCFQRTTSKQILTIHPQARRMVSHNKQWIYVFHIDGDFAIVDRILNAKNIKQ
jgi:hypothetical protein